MSLGLTSISAEKLKQMSREDLYQLYRLLKDYGKARQQRKAEHYLETAHEGQMKFHKAKNRIKIFLGGNRSGKTTGGTIELYWRVRGTHPYRICRTPIKACIVVQDFTTHAKDIIEPKIQEWFPPGFIVKTDTNHAKAVSKYYCANGSTIDVKTHDQDLKVFEGSDYDYVWFDEPPPELIFKAVWRGLVDRDGECAITGTPIVEPWMYDHVADAEREDFNGLIWYTYVNSYQNAVNLGEGDRALGIRRLQQFEALLDEDERMARIEGKFLHLKGLIFKGWDRKIHLIQPFKWPNEWPIVFSVDPHEEKPWAVSFLGVTENYNKILIASELVPGVISQVAHRAIDMRNEILMDDPRSKPRITQSWIDNAAGKPLMEKSKPDGQKITALEEFNSEISPYIPKCRPAPKNVREKIQIMKKWLHPKDTQWGPRPEFMVFDTDQNRRFRHEIEHYRWQTYTGKQQKNELKDGQPIKKDDDILDTIMQAALVLGSSQTAAEFEEKGPIRYAGR